MEELNMTSKHLKSVHGEGSIRYRKDKDLWEARYTTGFDKEGKQIQKSVYGKSPEEVREKLTKTLVKIDEGSYIEPSKMPVGDWLDNWLFSFKQSTLKPTTFGTYEQNIRNHIKPSLGHIPLKDLKLDAIQELYNNQLKMGRCDGECENLSTASVIKIHTILSQALDKAVEKEMIYKNPAKFAELPPLVEKPCRVLTMNEQIKFMQVVKQHRMRAAILFAMGTGLRVGEMLALKWSDVDLHQGTVKIVKQMVRVTNFEGRDRKGTQIVTLTPKTKCSTRIIPLSDAMITVLKQNQLLQENEKADAGSEYAKHNYVFATELGTYYSGRNLLRLVYIFSEKAGIERINVHTLRHVFATRMLEAGEAAKIVQEILGHEDITTTLNRYTHVLPDTKKKSVQKLNHIFAFA